MRGELSRDTSRPCCICGSSPRMRGTVIHLSAVLHEPRFIPTNAGNGPTPFSSPSPTSVHPHVCGERATFLHVASSMCGSSPRVRGADETPDRGPGNGRFIPTCAGSSRHDPRQPPWCAVHPHVRGEQLDWVTAGLMENGSSPRTRGAGCFDSNARPTARFIPTCAGSRLDRL